MRTLFTFLVFLTITGNCLAQSFSVHFPEILYDFGYIKESEGKVSHTFYFINNEKESIEIKEVAASCGCMLPKASGKKLEPGEKGFIEIDYDPAGRPGKFIKSLEITFVSPSKGEHTFFMNIKGVVIEKEILPAYNEAWETAILQIRPFSAPVVSGSDFRFMNRSELQDFVNDITYEIDRSGFVTVKLELMLRSQEPSVEMSEALFLPIKKFIITELKRRNYTANQVGFADNPYVKSDRIPSDAMGLIKISSLDYNNDSIPESGFFNSKEDPTEAFRKKEQLRAREDSIASVRLAKRSFSLEGKKLKIDSASPSFEAFMELVIRQVLVAGSAQVGLKIESSVPNEKIENEYLALQKEVISLEKQIISYCESNGISGSKINFSVPNLIVTVSPKASLKKALLFHLPPITIEEQFDPFELLMVRNDTLRRRFPVGEKGLTFHPPLQDLPTYQAFVPVGKTMIDTSRTEFKLWLNVMAEELKGGKKIRFLIESTASNSPLAQKTDNHFLARKRARELQAGITALLLKQGVTSQTIRFEEAFTTVQGPKYDSRAYGISLYDKYNYLKVIPIYDTVTNVKSELFPYQVNFNYNYFELPANSEIFQVFINRLIPEIDKKGYVRIIIESSSSRINSPNYYSNESLSFFRAENAKNKLRDEIRKRGYDPKRVIIVEERTLVQGPAYIPGTDIKSPTYERFQYIKIIPESLIRRDD